MKKLSSQFLLLFLFLSNDRLFAQAYPDMWVPMEYSIARIENFSRGSNSKFNRLKRLNTVQDKSLVYSTTAIRDIISKIPVVNKIGLRVYFARYDKLTPLALLPHVEDNKVILIFSYSYSKRKYPEAKYYFIDDRDAANPVIEITDKVAVKRWLTNYNTYCQDILRSDLIPDNLDDDDDENPGKKVDTKSIFYPLNEFKEATIIEEGYTHRLYEIPITISAYKFSFSAFGRDGRPYEPELGRWRKRMQLDINYMYPDEGVNTVFYLEELDNRWERNRATAIAYLKKLNKKQQNSFAPNGINRLTNLQISGILRAKSIDNGQLCPTNCPR